MRLHVFCPDSDHLGRYNSAAHESLRAVGRCMLVAFGEAQGRYCLETAVGMFGANTISKLSESQAYEVRRFLETMLPACAA